MSLAACSGAEGGIREPCYPNGTCNAGLLCLSEVCVGDPADAGVSADGGIESDASGFREACGTEYVPITATDFDEDGVPDSVDNCPRLANVDQGDGDGDRVGDACDNAPLVSNLDQSDIDADGQGDVSDGDMDGDGVPNTLDNCPEVVNPTQMDTAGNGVGDACDPDDDADGIPDGSDPCPKLPGVIDPSTLGCAGDEDLDGILDQLDNCVGVANPSQGNMDGDGLGDACDPDVDGDGVLNHRDNAPIVRNSDQADLDRDGLGDAADPVLCLDRAPPNVASCMPLDNNLQVRTMLNQTALVGQPLLLRFFVNQLPPLTGWMYSWSVIDGPGELMFVDDRRTGAPRPDAYVEWTSDVKVVPSRSGTFRLRVEVSDGTGRSASAELRIVAVDSC